MKKILSLVVLSMALSSVASANAKFKSVTSYEVVSGQLPPHLMLSFNLTCFQHLVDFVRKDVRDPNTNEVTIYVGGFVDGEPTPCPTNAGKIISVDAGPTYSGVSFHIEEIR